MHEFQEACRQLVKTSSRAVGRCATVCCGHNFSGDAPIEKDFGSACESNLGDRSSNHPRAAVKTTSKEKTAGVTAGRDRTRAKTPTLIAILGQAGYGGEMMGRRTFNREKFRAWYFRQ